MQRLAAFVFASFAAAACAAVAEPSVMVEVPAGAVAPSTGHPAWKPVLQPSEPGSDRIAEQSLSGIVRDYCLPALEQPHAQAAIAERLGVRAVANPWTSDPASYLAPSQAWTVAGSARIWFWVEKDEAGVSSSCWIKAFDGRRSRMAPATLSVIEQYAASNGFGATRYPAASLSRLERLGSIERIYSARDFSASLSLDRSDYPANDGFVVIISAEPLSQATGS
jgi:hypothetical protein